MSRPGEKQWYESVASRVIESFMKLYKDELRQVNEIFLSDGCVQITYNEETQSIEVTRPEAKTK